MHERYYVELAKQEKVAQPQHVKWLLTDQCGYMLP